MVELTDAQKQYLERTDRYWKSEMRKWLDTLSERVRTLVIGTLAVIWGLFTGEGKGIIHLRRGSTLALFGIACAAVVVLTLDFVEYVMGYNEAIQRTSDIKSVSPTFDFATWKRRVLEVKMGLGVITLIALVISLITIFSVSLWGQDYSMRGKWCGKNANQDPYSYLILDIQPDSDPPTVWYFGTMCPSASWEPGASPDMRDHLKAECTSLVKISDAWKEGNGLRVRWYTGSNNEENFLHECSGGD